MAFLPTKVPVDWPGVTPEGVKLVVPKGGGLAATITDCAPEACRATGALRRVVDVAAGFAAGAGAVLALIHDGTPVPMGYLVAALGLLSLLSCLMLRSATTRVKPTI